MSGLATVVAWVALAGWIAAGVLLVLAHRRLDALERAQTDRKWEIIALRAELRRRARDAGTGPGERGTPGADPGGQGTFGADSGGRGTAGADPGGVSRTRRAGGIPDGATAWRRAHRRPGRPRRRRPS